MTRVTNTATNTGPDFETLCFRSNATFRATNVDDLFYLTVFSAPFCSLDPTDDFEHLKNLNRASKATAGSKGKLEVELMKIECRNWYTARVKGHAAIACSINSSTFVVNSGASKFSRRRIDLSRQARRIAPGCLVVDREVCVTSWVTWGITRAAPSKNASYQSEAVPRLRRGSNTNNSVQSPPRKTVGWNTSRTAAPG
ncbi:unnamed protein product [Brugia pahangi]|uniref:Uncharacterized protein n=1 Tax=Brugia pahangi TaxID=6280 RepID=A0A0N4SZN8_BRUPA|nr:unnamed protein product [Brugia pahangi]